jgi:NADH:ubiquinone oxidoreductase subunit 3 (subunit A)
MWFGLTVMVVVTLGLLVWILYATGILSRNKNKKGKQDS